jgi:hypothetical protein
MPRKFWVVSPNVRFNRVTEPKWREAIVRLRSAFMGWGSEDKNHSAIGFKFAHLIRPGDVILVARRYHGRPDLVGVGVVAGRFEVYRRSIDTPQEFGSRRRLRPFKPLTKAPSRVPIMSALGHIKALRQLHPETDEDQRLVCDWLLTVLSLPKQSVSQSNRHSDIETLVKELRLGAEPEYKVQRRKSVAIAKRTEAKLVLAYQKWLENQSRVLHLAKYGRLVCDAYEKTAITSLRRSGVSTENS